MGSLPFTENSYDDILPPKLKSWSKLPEASKIKEEPFFFISKSATGERLLKTNIDAFALAVSP